MSNFVNCTFRVNNTRLSVYIFILVFSFPFGQLLRPSRHVRLSLRFRPRLRYNKTLGLAHRSTVSRTTSAFDKFPVRSLVVPSDTRFAKHGCWIRASSSRHGKSLGYFHRRKHKYSRPFSFYSPPTHSDSPSLLKASPCRRQSGCPFFSVKGQSLHVHVSVTVGLSCYILAYLDLPLPLCPFICPLS